MAARYRVFVSLSCILTAMSLLGCGVRRSPSASGENQTAAAQTPKIDIPTRSLKAWDETAPFRLIGRLGEPIGTCLTAQCVILDRGQFGDEPRVRVERINDRPLAVPIAVTVARIHGTQLGALLISHACEIDGFEDGGFTGVPCEARLQKEADLSENAFRFISSFIAVRAASLSRIQRSPDDFVDQQAWFTGQATSSGDQSLIEGDGWRLVVDASQRWADEMENKQVEAYGVIRKTEEPNVWTMAGCTTRSADAANEDADKWVASLAIPYAESPTIVHRDDTQTAQVDVPFDLIPGEGVETPYRIIGKLGLPLGTVVTLEGTIVEGFFKDYDHILLRVQRINGRPTQACVSISPRPYDDKDDAASRIQRDAFGSTFEMEGYETGFYAGIPGDCMEKGNLMVQTYVGCFFYSYFVAFQSAVIAPIQFAPCDFEDQTALLEGLAVSDASRSFIAGDGWRLLADDTQPWPAVIEGKEVEGYGVIRATNATDVWRLEGGWTRLVNLEDQVGKEVILRGLSSWVRNNAGTLNYRGTAVYVDGLSESDLSLWKERDFGPVVVRGRLEEAMLPDPRKDPGTNDPTLKKCYIVRNASFEPLDKLLSPEYPQKSASSFDR